MSVEFISDVLKNSRSTGLDKFVLVCLANYAGESGLAWPSVKRLADRCGISESSVHKCIKSLLALGEVELVEIGGRVNEKKHANKYQLHIPKDPYNRVPCKRPSKKDLEETGASSAPVRELHPYADSTGAKDEPVRNTEKTGASHEPVPVRTANPNPSSYPSVNRQISEDSLFEIDKFQKKDDQLETLRIRIGSWFRRRPDSKWSPREIKALKFVLTLNTPESDLSILEERYTDKSVKYLRQDPLTLLNNFNGEIDRAKAYADGHNGNGYEPVNGSEARKPRRI